MPQKDQDGLSEEALRTIAYDEEAVEPNPEDTDSSNVLLRAGYLRGMAIRLPPGDDQTFLKRASRSLVAYAVKLRSEGK